MSSWFLHTAAQLEHFSIASRNNFDVLATSWTDEDNKGLNAFFGFYLGPTLSTKLSNSLDVLLECDIFLRGEVIKFLLNMFASFC